MRRAVRCRTGLPGYGRSPGAPRIFAHTVHAFYTGRAEEEGISGAKTGSVVVVQRTSSDLRLNPHLHLVALDGAYHEECGELVWHALGHLQTSEVGEVLGRALRRIEKHLRRRGVIRLAEGGAELGAEGGADPESQLAASAVSGQVPPAGPQWVRGLEPLEHRALAYEKPLCASLDGFSLHAATHAGALDQTGREALLRYVLRPPIASERLERRPDALVRITLKKAYADGTVAVDMDPLSLLCRLASSVPPPASPWRSRIAPKPPAQTGEPETPKRAGGYRPWAELLARTFAVDVLACPSCQGRMKLLAMVTDPHSVARYLAVGEPTELPRRSPSRGPPYWKSIVLRRQVVGEEDGGIVSRILEELTRRTRNRLEPLDWTRRGLADDSQPVPGRALTLGLRGTRDGGVHFAPFASVQGGRAVWGRSAAARRSARARSLPRRARAAGWSSLRVTWVRRDAAPPGSRAVS